MILITDLRKCLLYLSLKDARFPLATAFAPPTCVQHALDVPRVVVLVTEVLDSALEGLGVVCSKVKSNTTSPPSNIGCLEYVDLEMELHPKVKSKLAMELADLFIYCVHTRRVVLD